MSTPPRIAWVNDDQATDDLAAIYEQWRQLNPGSDRMPDILKCFSARPDFLRQVMAFSNGLHFSDGYLTRRIKEMIATYVSGLNHCRY